MPTANTYVHMPSCIDAKVCRNVTNCNTHADIKVWYDMSTMP